MKNLKFLIGIVLAVALMVTQFAEIFAAPTAGASPITGSVSEVTLETDPTTGIITVIVTVVDSSGVSQTVRISEKSASKLGLIDYDSADGNPFIAEPLPSFIIVNPKMVISD